MVHTAPTIYHNNATMVCHNTNTTAISMDHYHNTTAVPMVYHNTNTTAIPMDHYHDTTAVPMVYHNTNTTVQQQ